VILTALLYELHLIIINIAPFAKSLVAFYVIIMR
jgi:hypothetical protein